ncbi:Hsp90 protein-domain-containing protein [Crassisporium funariophilum]|nr:Hsp90 protein-domain-containing protein [Crassisporium funariophilum]
MSALPFAAFSIAPLPSGWTEHLGPGGQPYYHNSQTQESTYIRPLPPIAAQPVKKKEKPLIKTPIPGTEWLRVTTTEGNIFYSHKLKKESVWVVPEELKAALETLQAEELRHQATANTNSANTNRQHPSENGQTVSKRKAEDIAHVDELAATKKAKVEEEEDGDSEEEEEEEEEDWQRDAAEQLAAEATQERERVEMERERENELKLLELQQTSPAAAIIMPQKVDLSIEEGKALFKTLLREKDINPLHPWDISLPKFVSDPRYVLLPSVAARREAFDEYCKERARELRQSTVKKEKEAANPKDEYDKLLKDEIKSTRASWTDFRGTWKKDRRFYGWGRDDREREKRFREFLKDLGEQKRAAAQKAEVYFFALLKESGSVKEGILWKEAKKAICKDPRYEAVGSSSLREELYQTFLKGQGSLDAKKQDSSDITTQDVNTKGSVGDRQERRNKAVKEREDKVKTERRRLDADIEKSKLGIDQEEGERSFRTLLTDAIRDPLVTWESVQRQLKTDPRFTKSALHPKQKLHLFDTHISHLRAKHINVLYNIFEANAPSLATPFSALPLEEILKSPPVIKLGYDIGLLEDEFNKWQRERTSTWRIAFDEMVGENSFIEFWGRLGKIGGEGVNGGVKIDDDDIGEGEGEEKVDMKALAKTVDIREMEKVLKNDKRYIMFEHVPDQRERWLRSDVARLRKIVINSLYSHQEIFLRELLSNANDALEKLRLTALTDKTVWDGTNPLNITIKADKDEDGKGGRIVIADTGIGMSPEELTANLGTLAKSGTSDFLAKAEGQEVTATGNLIGAFGLGFYSSFLVADRVQVASIPPPSAKNPNPVQHIFSSSADDSTFDVYPDPRGNTLERGTEVTLFLKPDALDYLDEAKLSNLVHKHSAYSSTFPIYLFEKWTEEVPDESVELPATELPDEDTPEPSSSSVSAEDDDEATVEDVVKDEENETPPPRMVNVTKEAWSRLNSQPPLWARDPKNITEDEYNSFYTSFFKDFSKPLAWHHFSADAGSGTAFKALLFFPSKLSEDFWQKPLEYVSKDFKLMVKRVFITSDIGGEGLPKWASWVKVVVDADDLPLNVSREMLQSNRFLKQLRQIIIKRMIQLFQKISEGDDQDKYDKLQETYGSVLKLAAVEDTKNRDKLAALTRFTTNQRNNTSFDQYLEKRKKGQKQIFYLAEMGKKPEDLAQSVFVEKLDARGYEVLLLTEPLDEILVGNLREWKHIPFQDVAKAGLKFGDEDLDPEEEKEQLKTLNEKFKPLLEWLKKEANDAVRDVVLSNRLVKSPCAIVADAHGYTANVQKMMSASNAKGNRGGLLHEYAMKAKLLEINPRSPLIEGLLRRVMDLPADEDERDLEAEEELKEVASILIDGALVRSGFEVPDSNKFFSRVDRVLRRSLGVSETATTDESVKPAPPIDPELPVNEPELPPVEDDGKPGVFLPDELKDQIQIDMEEIDEEGNPVVQVEHDEL